MKYLFLICCIFLLSGVVHSKTTTKRAVTPPVDLHQKILHDLSGHWVGHGMTVLAVPAFDSVKFPRDFEVKVFHHHETLTFSGIREGIRNAQGDDEINLKALHYLQQIVDMTTSAELHLEPGCWMYVPASTNNNFSTPVQLYRSGVIPHGNSFLAGSTDVRDEKKPPVFEENFSLLPFPQHNESARFGLNPNGYTSEYTVTTKFPKSLIPKYTDGSDTSLLLDPTLFLKKDIEGQNICQTKTITISTIDNEFIVDNNGNGVVLGAVTNIPSLTIDANVAQVEATFYIEKVKDVDGTFFWQLQYFQEVYLDFPVKRNGVLGNMITWPHVSVATLRKQAGEYV